MRSHHIRTFGLIVGLIAVLGMASIAAGESLTDQQIGRQIERRLSPEIDIIEWTYALPFFLLSSQ